MRQIIFHEETKTFHLYNEKISYILCVLENGHLGQLYFGKRLHDKADFSYLVEKCERPMTSYIYEWDRTFSLEHIRLEYPVYGTTDYRHPAIELLQENGSRISEFQYDSYEIIDGKPKLSGLPATYTESEEEAQTLRIFLKDALTGAKLALLYTIFDEYSAIARSAYIENAGEKNLHVLNMMSLSLDLPDKDYEWMQLSGAWSRERYIKNRTLEQGITAIDSMRGNSSHEHNPFLVLKRHNTDENAGEAIGISLVYSGNFRMQAEVDTHDVTRITAGINPEGFDWKLEPGESFQTPEAVLVYSENGLNGMSQTFQKLYAKRLARGYWRDKARPILNNNWEATYFDFDTDKLLDIAREAKKDGIEMLVMDDGWFGKRNKDDSSLGDWVVNEEKIKGGLKNLVDKVNEIGLEFGIWFEPEMISPDSDLYREHPEWAIQIPGREATEIRCQYVLDLSRPEVQDYAYECVAKILRSANIKYVKWDMNRQLSDLGSTYLDKDSQQELFHRYVLGMYAMQERLIQEFPDLLLENCSGGGARFDPGMLYYSPQIWCSDDTDAIERLEIQEGTALIYPLCSMGAHVSVCPNHTVGRVTPFTTRGHVALAGTFGYELDITKLPEEERKLIPEQTAMYHKYHELIREGEYYRILSSRENHRSDCWAVASEDKSEVLVTYVQVLAQANMPSRKVRLRGFDPAKKYRLEGTDEVYSGEMLMNAGFRMKDFWGDFVSRLYHFVAVD